MPTTPTWIDRTITTIAPRWQLKRMRARMSVDLLQRHYEAATVGRRTQGWNRSATDANAANGWAGLSRLREVGRDMVRNDGQMRAALRTIANHTVGTGIVATPSDPAIAPLWKQWAETTDCDADGRDDLYGLEKLVMRGVAESGEMLVRRRWRRLADGYAIPLQLQVLEPDLLDTSRTMPLPNGGQIIQGIEFDVLGNLVAYWMFPKHPGSTFQMYGTIMPASKPIPASEILHIFERERAGQVRAVSWFASVAVSAKDLDEYYDAQLMKQKIAACLAVITTDLDGSAPAIGTADASTSPEMDMIEPGAIMNVPPGRTVQVVQPPSVRDFEPFVAVINRKIAKGLGLSYEDFVGDYSQVNFSSARMSRLEHYENVYDWRWRLMVPQFCLPVWKWAVQAMQVMGEVGPKVPSATWTAPSIPFIEPDKEGLAIQRLIRSGLTSTPEALRERGIDPDAYLKEQADWNKKVDASGIMLDSDPRKMTQAGQAQVHWEVGKGPTVPGGATNR